MWKVFRFFKHLVNPAPPVPESGDPPFINDLESMMKEIRRIYTEDEIGLNDISMSMHNGSLSAPGPKVPILVVGHHHLAKGKFLDLHFDDSRQGGFFTKVDINNLDKIVVTQSNQIEWLQGPAVIDHCPQLAHLQDVPGLCENLWTETVKKNRSSLVSFILVPETLPTSQSLTFDDIDDKPAPPTDKVDIIGKLAEASDLIFVFFDPTGVVSPEATLAPLVSLWEDNHKKIHLILAKAAEDECEKEDRDAVLTKILSELRGNSELLQVGHLPQIHFPNLTTGVKDDIRLWSMIQRAEYKLVERALSQLELDADMLLSSLEAVREENDKARKNSLRENILNWAIYRVTPFLIVVDEVLCHAAEVHWITRVLNKVKIVVTVGFAVTSALLIERMWNWKKPLPLKRRQEQLLHKRIHFAQCALHQNERMFRIFAALSGGSQGIPRPISAPMYI